MTRLELIKQEMAKEGVDAIYLTSSENHRYACAFNNPDGQVLITKNKSYVFADFRYIEAARREAADGFEVVMPMSSEREYLPQYAAENDVKTLGFEEDNMTYSHYKSLSEALCGIEMVPS